LLRIDAKLETPVYRQIVDGLRVGLVNGELAPGDSLPPVRRLALDIGVHFNTVAEAYRELAREGWIEISVRSGARVIRRPKSVSSGSDVDSTFRRRIEEFVAQLQGHGMGRSSLARELRRIAKALEET
jgi:GntR family transcriptional regulator